MQTQEQSAPSAAKLAPYLLWYATLGGPVAWVVHLLIGWSIVEVPCSRGHTDLAGVPVRVVVTLATVVFALVALGALVVAWRLRQRLAAVSDPSRQISRAHFMAEVGLWLDLLAFVMIVMVGAAIPVFATCAR